MIDRWRDSAETDTAEGRAGELLRSVRPLPPTPELEGKVQGILRGEPSKSRLGRPLPVLAIIAGMFLLAGGAAAATAVYQRYRAPIERKPIAHESVSNPVPVPVETPVETPVPVPVPTPIAPHPAPPPPPNPSALALESKRIKAAVEALRTHDPARALEELATYEQAHPNGLLHHEALLAKISALIALDREPEALAILDAAPLDDHPRSLQLTVLRGELRARASRCTDAAGDFERALTKDLDDDLRTRADRGLARCRTP